MFQIMVSSKRARAFRLFASVIAEQIGYQLDGYSRVYMKSVERVVLNGFMHIDSRSLESLQIFCDDPHPSLVKGSGRSKEGFSLFGLLNQTATVGGHKMLQKWMLAPLVDRGLIDERLDAVDFMLRSEHEALRQQQSLLLKQVGDLGGVFRRIKTRSASVRDWCSLYNTAEAFLQMHARFELDRNSTGDLPALISNSVRSGNPLQLSATLRNVIDFEESRSEKEVIVRSGVSDALDQARDKYQDLDNILTEIAYQIQEVHPTIAPVTVQYIPQVGYVVCCDSATTIPEFVFQFQEDDTTFFYKDSCCRDLDDSIGDVFGMLVVWFLLA
ncbi:TPA: hypothetical protein N0F65_004300 [Lagenidium giganteum]|uniref:DNA mismatch repair protein MutS core domain-containing protein n=1 Tax=Lagenidium giganteum TaxID=4803 RepID=A0AAV2ZBQ8_9STRA|nr:TPA: hypothetical protein N0F65_004300 [Lagenidium giganteum]